MHEGKIGVLCLAPDGGPRHRRPASSATKVGEDKLHRFRRSSAGRPIWFTGRMLLTEIDHVAIAVRDLDAAIDYYQRAFGAEVDHREVVEQRRRRGGAAQGGRQLHPAAHADRDRLAGRQVRSRSGARACTTSATASTTAPRRSAAMVAAGAHADRRGAPPGQPRHHGGLRPPEGQLRHADRARPGVRTPRPRPVTARDGGRIPARRRRIDRRPPDRHGDHHLDERMDVNEYSASGRHEYAEALRQRQRRRRRGTHPALFADDAQVYFPKGAWPTATRRSAAVRRRRRDVEGDRAHYSHFNWVSRPRTMVCGAPATASHQGRYRGGPGRRVAGRALVRPVRDPDFLLQRCFIYLDPPRAGGTRPGSPGSRRADAAVSAGATGTPSLVTRNVRRTWQPRVEP